MRLEVPLPLHSGDPSSVPLCSIDPEVSKMTRMLGRSDCARATPEPSAIINPDATHSEATPRAVLFIMRGVPRSTIDGAVRGRPAGTLRRQRNRRGGADL